MGILLFELQYIFLNWQWLTLCAVVANICYHKVSTSMGKKGRNFGCVNSHATWFWKVINKVMHCFSKSNQLNILYHVYSIKVLGHRHLSKQCRPRSDAIVCGIWSGCTLSLIQQVFFFVLAAGEGRWGLFLFLLFLHFHSFSFLPCPTLSSPLLLYLFSLSLGDYTKWPTRVDVSLNPNSIKTNRFLRHIYG